MTTQNVFTMYKWAPHEDNGLKDALDHCQHTLSEAIDKNSISSGVVAVMIEDDLASLRKTLKCRLIIDADYEEYEKAIKESNDFTGDNVQAYAIEEFLGLKEIEI